MHIVIKKYALLLFCTASIALLNAQVSIQFMPALHGQTVNGLFTAQLQNAGAATYKGQLKITVRDSRNKVVLLAVAPGVSVIPGANFIQTLAPHTRIQFGNSAASSLLAQSGRFPENDYEYCFEFIGSESKPNAGEQVFENCFNYSIQPVIPMSLVYPAEGDELCITKPSFNWQPAMPLVSSYRYRILVTELKDKQQPAEAIMNNTPVFQQDNINGFMLMYPPQVPELQQERKYVWQVLAYQGNIKVTQSEIWPFSIHCTDKKTDSARESYRQLSAIVNGNYYTANGQLRLSLLNPYEKTKLAYSITDLEDPTREFRNLPPVKVQTGLNKIVIPLEDIHGLETGKLYLLRVTNIGDHVLYLQFIYKENEQ